jgi:hypothetical protein
VIRDTISFAISEEYNESELTNSTRLIPISSNYPYSNNISFGSYPHSIAFVESTVDVNDFPADGQNRYLIVQMY